MGNEKQTSMHIGNGGKFKLKVSMNTDTVIHKTFSTQQSFIKLTEDKLQEIRNKIERQKTAEKKRIMADDFIQSKMRKKGKMVYAEGDYDENWKALRLKLLGS